MLQNRQNSHAVIAPAVPFVALPAAMMLGAGADAVMGWQAAYAEAYRRAAEQVRAREEARRNTVRWYGREVILRFGTARNSAGG